MLRLWDGRNDRNGGTTTTGTSAGYVNHDRYVIGWPRTFNLLNPILFRFQNILGSWWFILWRARWWCRSFARPTPCTLGSCWRGACPRPWAVRTERATFFCSGTLKASEFPSIVRYKAVLGFSQPLTFIANFSLRYLLLVKCEISEWTEMTYRLPICWWSDRFRFRFGQFVVFLDKYPRSLGWPFNDLLGCSCLLIV